MRALHITKKRDNLSPDTISKLLQKAFFAHSSETAMSPEGYHASVKPTETQLCSSNLSQKPFAGGK